MPGVDIESNRSLTATEEAKTRKLAELRASGDQRAAIFDEPFTITTGVPRPAKMPSWEPDAPTSPYRDRYAEERSSQAPVTDDWAPPPPVEWRRFTTVTRLPKGDDPGQIMECEWSVQYGSVCVRDFLTRTPIGTSERLHEGDSILAAARKVVREKGKSTAFHDPLPPSTRRTA